MTIKIYKNTSDYNVLDKNISQLGSDLTGTLKEECSIIDPVITIENFTSFDITKANYAYISEFNRYYFINNIVCITDKLFELHMHVDVLKTYASGIRNCKAIIARSEHSYNLYLQDGVFKTKAFPYVEIKQFPSGFTDFNFIFCVAG